MESLTISELMVSLDEYAVVDEKATLLDAMKALRESQKKLAPGRPPHRAVLVTNGKGQVCGKIDQLAFLRALEPRYSTGEDMKKLRQTNIDEHVVSSMMEHSAFFHVSLEDICWRARQMPVTEVMNPVTESIYIDRPLREAIHRIVNEQALSLLVRRDGEIIGLIRLSDIFDSISSRIIDCENDEN